MEKIDQIQNESAAKGNSEDSLLAIYILRILKKYSSPQNPLSSQDVMNYLKKDYSIGNSNKVNAQRKKVRRHLDTLYENYYSRCIKKEEGKTRNGHKWYYDVFRDEFAKEEGVVRENLSKEEIDFIIDIIASSKIINSASTISIIKKLLKKGKHSRLETNERFRKIANDEWPKSINKELMLIQQRIEACRQENRKIMLDYEDKKSISVTPYGWGADENKNYALIAKIDGAKNGEFSSFSLDKIQNVEKSDLIDIDEFDNTYFNQKFGRPDILSMDSLFSNIKIINNAIKEKNGIEFKYLSYIIKDKQVVIDGKDKRVLPHRLVFNNGKYHLIGYDEEHARVDYFRVDLISKLNYSNTKIKISDFNAHTLSMIEGSKEVEKHPLMLAGKENLTIFNVLESALDRVIDAFAVKPDKFDVTEETRMVKNSSGKDSHEERVVSVQVKTTAEEAFRWALANADAVELVYPPDLRHKLRQIATPIYRSYAKTMEDRVQANIERVFATGTFQINQRITEDIANETFNSLNDNGNNDVTNEIKLHNVDADKIDYLGEFLSAKWLSITNSPCKSPKWIQKLNELVNIQFFTTSISDVSWLSNLKNLKIVRLIKSPISDLSILKDHQNILLLELREIDIQDISFIEKLPRILNLQLVGCPIKDYSPLLRMNPLDYLVVDEKAIAAVGMDNLIKHHPDAIIKVQQKIDNRKI